MKFLLPLSVIFMLSACTTKDYYEAFQTDKFDCMDLPTSKQEACNKKVDSSMSYEEYQKERKKL